MLSVSNPGGKKAEHASSQGIPLPRGWPRHVKSAMSHVIALAQYAVAYTRSWALNDRTALVRLQDENDLLQQKVALLREEIRIKDARMKRVAPQTRPHHAPAERMAVLELRAATVGRILKEPPRPPPAFH